MFLIEGFMKIRREFTCPLELAHDMIKGKWKTIIMWRLRLGNTTPTKLENDIKGITQKMLLQHLKELMDYGLVDKKVYDGYPLRVEYFLTPIRGQQMLEVLKLLQKIGIDYLKDNNQDELLMELGLLEI
jgi:DNA-binding HxlR family transcriptional regulator